MKDSECTDFLQWALPRLHRPWRGFRKVRGQVCKRVDRRLRELGLSDAHAYRAYLASHPHEWPILDALCPITISVFYRDTAVFDAVAASVLPELARAARARSQKNLRALCVGCACGEEPYTLALAWHFAVAPAFPGTELHIIATDVLEEVLARARDGCYAAGSLKLLPAAWRTGAFERKNDVRCLKPEFRERIEFVRQDVRAGLPAGPFDLILCRNLVFTYFDVPAQRELLTRISQELREGGALVIGAREALPLGSNALVDWPSAARRGIFRLVRGRALGPEGDEI